MPVANTDGIWEEWVITTFKSIRILCFQDKGNLVVLTDCFLKKSQKIPKPKIKCNYNETERLVRRLNDCGGKVKFTRLENKGHGIQYLYEKNPEINKWILEQRNKNAT